MSESGGESFYYFHTEKFIEEVKKRPPLYNPNAPKGADHKKTKDRLWQEVCEAIVPNWEQLDDHTKLTEGQDILRKWKNLRDNFRKELNIQQKLKLGTIKNRSRRKYVYYDKLMFLLPFMQERRGAGSLLPVEEAQPPKTENVQTETDDDDGSWQEEDRKPLVHLESIDVVEHYNADLSENSATNASFRASARKRKIDDNGAENVTLESAENQQRDKRMDAEDIDEDKFFLLSLLPSFKKLTDSQKFLVKMQYLQVLQETFSSSEF